MTVLGAQVRSWGTSQVLGPPDTAGAGDISTAWASASQDGQPEWLILEYETPIRPAKVLVHETFNPGALCRVSVFDAADKETVVWNGSDPTPMTQSRGVSAIPVEIDFKVTRIKVYLNSPAVPGWNEIDAVGVLSASGKKYWATGAFASSSFGKNNPPPKWYSDLF